jgi:hypothetical protein
MMNIAHLWWIVPLAVAIGYSICCILRVGKEADERMDETMRNEQPTWVSILERYPTKDDADNDGNVIVYGMRHNDFSDKHVYLADWDDTSVYPYVSTHWIKTPKILDSKKAFPQAYDKLDEIFPTGNEPFPAGTVTITGTDQYGNERTETIPVPGVSKNKYVNIKKER